MAAANKPPLRCQPHPLLFIQLLLLSLLAAPAQSFSPTLPPTLRPQPQAARHRTPLPTPLLATASPSRTQARAAARAYTEVADDASWLEANDGGVCTVEKAMYCGLVDGTDMAAVLVTYMEECNEEGKRLNPQASDVLRSLLSHQVGSQGFWTMFLTDPDLQYCTEAPFDPALLSALARFPELNMGVLSSCLAMSATEETVYSQDGDAAMRENAALSRLRVLKLLAAATTQPDIDGGDNGCNWLLDLVDYDLLMQCLETAEMRGVDVTSGNVLTPATGIFSGVQAKRKMSRSGIANKALEIAESFAGGEVSEASEEHDKGERELRKDIGTSTRKKKDEGVFGVVGKIFGGFVKFVDDESKKKR